MVAVEHWAAAEQREVVVALMAEVRPVETMAAEMAAVGSVAAVLEAAVSEVVGKEVALWV